MLRLVKTLSHMGAVHACCQVACIPVHTAQEASTPLPHPPRPSLHKTLIVQTDPNETHCASHTGVLTHRLWVSSYIHFRQALASSYV